MSVKYASDSQLQLCKAAAVLRGVQYGLSPLTTLHLFDQLLVKYSSELGVKSALWNPFRKGPTDQQRTAEYLKYMQNRGLEQSQGYYGFTPQDQVSKARLKAIVDGLAKVPITATAAGIAKTKQMINS